MAAAVVAEREADSWRDATIYMWIVSAVGTVIGTLAFARADPLDLVEIAPWVLAALAGDALAVRFSSTVALSASLPVTLAAAFVLPIPAVGIVGFLSVWQLPGKTVGQFGRNLFNRVEVAVAATCAALVVGAFGEGAMTWPLILVASGMALLADALANAALMTPVVCLGGHRSVRTALEEFVGLRPVMTMAAYGSAALAAPILVDAWIGAGVWGLAAAMVCVGLAGLAVRSAQELGSAEAALSSTRALLQQGSSEVIRERREERRRLAGELHDEVLPALYRVHLMAEVVRRDLETGRLLDLEEDVKGLSESTGIAQSVTRSVVGSLLESPIGVRGLGRAVKALADGLVTNGAHIDLDLGEIRGDERSQAVAFQVVREAVTNAAKYSKGTRIGVRLRSEEGILHVSVVDDGCGFDVASAANHLGHYGLALMKERVESIGGSLFVDSRLGGGTSILASIPTQRHE